MPRGTVDSIRNMKIEQQKIRWERAINRKELQDYFNENFLCTKVT